MTLHRFLASGIRLEGPACPLPPEEAEHATRVLRLGSGDMVRVFDGGGLEFVARIEHASRQTVTVRAVEQIEAAAETAVRLTLAQSILKPSRMETAVRDAAMLGVAAIQPLVAARTVVPAEAARSAAVRDRWRRIALASIKQCGRAVLPEVREPIDVERLIDIDQSEIGLVLVEPAAHVEGAADVRRLADRPRPSTVTLVIGPEGGWAPAEVDQLIRAGYLATTLGRRTFRAEAVAVAAVAVLQYIWNDL
jgi:16S rRNA (uracil1498-N3)-methyltransferase